MHIRISSSCTISEGERLDKFILIKIPNKQGKNLKINTNIHLKERITGMLIEEGEKHQDRYSFQRENNARHEKTKEPAFWHHVEGDTLVRYRIYWDKSRRMHRCTTDARKPHILMYCLGNHMKIGRRGTE